MLLIHVVRKELLDQLRSLRFAITCGVCLVVLMLSSIVLTRDYREAQSTYNMNRVIHRNDLEQRTDVRSLWEGVTVDRPLNPLNTMVRGLSDGLTESVKIQPGNRLDFPERWEQNPILALFPSVDYVFIVGIIMSLLALALSYDSVSAEAESGVLRLLMSYSVPRDTVLLGKWIGGYISLMAPFTVAFVLSVLVSLLYSEVELRGNVALGLLSLYGLAMLYLAAIFSLGLFISSCTRLASTSITVLLLVWVVFILAIPNTAPYFVGQLLPLPSRESIDREKQAMERDALTKFQQMIKDEQERTSREDVWADEAFRVEIEARQQNLQEEMEKVDGSFGAQVRSQTRWSGIVARISPLTSFKLAAFDLASAGLAQEERYVASLKAYSESWQAYTEEKQKIWEDFMDSRRDDNGRVLISSEDMEQFRRDNRLGFSDAPGYDFAYMSFADRLSEVSLDLLLLVIWNILFFLLAYLSFLRYELTG
ncbi:MAG: ABC transporter permease [Candidatus Latescibacterota bacterium]|nr:ABC transporter permease [Candidatus Latescibacterota bacterium]